MQKYIGRVVEIVYLDRLGNATHRKVRVQSIKNGKLKAYCYDRQAPRVFKIENILAYQLVVKRA